MELRGLFFYLLFCSSSIQIQAYSRWGELQFTFRRRQEAKCVKGVTFDIAEKEIFEHCRDKVAFTTQSTYKHPYHGKTTPQMVRMLGYYFRSYEVVTDDGYILTVHRIPGSPLKPYSKDKPVVLLMHGMLFSSESWFMLEGQRGLAAKLVEKGYDVWMSNSRGSSYSTKHKQYNWRFDLDYWDFSWHEMAMYDLPAVVNKILKNTEKKKILYIGFSMGSTQYLVGLSENPELNKRIEAAVLLSPVSYMGSCNSPIRLITPVGNVPSQKLLGPFLGGRIGEPDMFSRRRNISSADYCVPSALRCGVCGSFMYFITGYNPEQTNYSNFANARTKMEDSTSLSVLAHFAQNINSCQFRKFDYGRVENVKRYGYLEPPEYRLDRITVPTYMFYGAGDMFALPLDVNTTVRKMRQGVVREKNLVASSRWNHMDFVSGKNADTLVFDKVVNILERYRPKNISYYLTK